MQLALSTLSAPPPVPAWGELSENSRLGFTSTNPALYLGHEVCNSTTAIGMRAGLALKCVGECCSGEQYDPDLGLYYLRARYYNPATGRFMSRDPEDGKPIDPKTLHRYLYAGGDPVNAKDPSGRADEEEEGGFISGVILPVLRNNGVIAFTVISGGTCVLGAIAEHSGIATGVPELAQKIEDYYCDLVGVFAAAVGFANPPFSGN